ncbi:MAG: aminotransferase class V-fold PLP-dependent enzyme [Clostridia bacterium]|nr:aminotransferase class V-fold PLP-dependent enzyme [Clostridia bacterium]
MIYFDNAATGGQKPEPVLTAVTAAVKLCANPGRSGHKLSLACARIVLDCRAALSDYFDGYGFERVAFTKNCTEALNLAIFGCLKPHDHVVTTCMEHNSVLRPLEKLKKAGVIDYDVCPLENGNVSPETFFALVRPNTKMAIVTAASNVTGAAPPLYELRAQLPESVLFCVDGAQGGGHIPLSLRKMGIDLLALAGHKGLHAIQGSGALLFSERVDPSPLLYGGTGSESFSLDMPNFFPDSLEAGTASFPAVSSLLAGVRYLAEHGEAARKKTAALTDYLHAEIEKIQDIRLYSKPNDCGIVSFSHRNLQSELFAAELNEKYSVAVRGGLHCAPLMHAALGSEENGLVRASLSEFNRAGEVEEFLSALHKIVGAWSD